MRTATSTAGSAASGPTPTPTPTPTRRDFLWAGAGGLGWALAGSTALGTGPAPADDRAVVLLLLVGGPSQLETFDPKPDAPAEVRGPFGSIATAVPGVLLGEHLPRLARRLDRVALIRSLHHDSAPIHETGHQLLQTGRLGRSGEVHPHFGSVAARALGTRLGGKAPPFALVPGPIGNTGVAIPHGQSAGWLGPEYEPATRAADDLSREPRAVQEAYGPSPFGRDCLRARRLVEAGARVVTVNMFDTVFDRVTWDCHGSAPFCSPDDVARLVAPVFDRAVAALLDDLDRLGRLDTTLVIASGEFGRTPKLNPCGGRDHWPGVWSALVAGGGVRGGLVVGASDPHAASPADRPVTPAELVATIYQFLGLDPAPEPTPLVDARPIRELFG